MIETRSISKIYGDGTRALTGLDLTFGDGMLGLLGPNGAGKTTFLQILTLALEPSAGERRYFGLDDRPANRPKIRRGIGYLPQEFVPVEGLTGLEYLEYCADVRQVPLRRRELRRRIAALLEAVELGHAGNHRADRYSGGMQRRLGLAQALVHAPKFLVVDEPTAGLDPEERIRFRNLVSDLADEIPVLLSTHIVEDIEATCPRLAVIDRGTLRFDGAPGDLMQRSEGRLWRLPAGTALPAGALKVAHRVDEAGGACDIVDAPQKPPGAKPVESTLDEAIAAFLEISAAEMALDREDGPSGATA